MLETFGQASRVQYIGMENNFFFNLLFKLLKQLSNLRSLETNDRLFFWFVFGSRRLRPGFVQLRFLGEGSLQPMVIYKLLGFTIYHI